MTGSHHGSAFSRRAALGGVVAATASVLSACGSGVRTAGSSGSVSTSAPSSTSMATAAPSTSASSSTSAQTTQESPTSTESPSPSTTQPDAQGSSGDGSGSTDATTGGTLKLGSKGSDVQAMQVALIGLGFWINGQDGTFGPSTQQAVWAFQKAYGLARTGQFTDTERTTLAAARRITPKLSGTRIEVDLARQLLIVNLNGVATWVFNTSTGWNKPFQAFGHTFNGRTPTGSFQVGRIYDSGWKTNELGSLYRPYFFNGAIAVHGAPKVPPYNASHGCCRVSIAAQDFLIKQGYLAKGRNVDVY